MATQAERLAAAEEENARQKAQIDILEAKLILVLDYLDQRVVDRLNKVEFDLNRLAVGSSQLVSLNHALAQHAGIEDAYHASAEPYGYIRDTVNTALPREYPMPPRTELEAQIVSPPTVTPSEQD